jgi:hypothetical protein
MKNAVFWDVAPCGSCKNRYFGVMYRLHHQDEKNRKPGTTLAVTANCSVLVTANVVPGSLTLSIPTMEAIHYSETLVLTKATGRYIPEDGIHKNMLHFTTANL